MECHLVAEDGHALHVLLGLECRHHGQYGRSLETVLSGLVETNMATNYQGAEGGYVGDYVGRLARQRGGRAGVGKVPRAGHVQLGQAQDL